MAFTSAIVLLITILGTAFLSGIFGMAGGLILMGVLLSLLSVPQAMLTHGLLQIVANGWRSYLLRRDVRLQILAWYCVGAVIAVALLFLIAWRPQRLLVFILLGLVPFLVWLPKSLIHLDIQKPAHAIIAGLLVTALNTFAGVAGPSLDIFFVRTTLTRHQIVATKSISQVIAHLVKILFWSGIAFAGAAQQSRELLWLIAIAIPISMLGTWMGGKLLNRFQDKTFLKWVKALVTLVGIVYLLRAGLMIAA